LVNSNTQKDSKGNITGMLAVEQDIMELVGYCNTQELRMKERTLKLNQAYFQQPRTNFGLPSPQLPLLPDLSKNTGIKWNLP
jgi:hypothetical protein